MTHVGLFAERELTETETNEVSAELVLGRMTVEERFRLGQLKTLWDVHRDGFHRGRRDRKCERCSELESEMLELLAKRERELSLEGETP